MAKKVRITKGNHIVSYFLFAVNISVSEKAIRPTLNVDSISPDLVLDFPRCLTCTDTLLSSGKMWKRDSLPNFFLRGGGLLYRRY